MPSYGNQIEACIKKVPENKIIMAEEFHRKKLSDTSDAVYYKTLERLSKKGELLHLTKGVYCRPRQSKYGVVPISETEIVTPFTESNKGLVVGYRLYNRYGISTQVSKNCDVLTNAINEEKKTIGSVRLNKLGLKLTPSRTKIIEALEILQGYSKVEDANEKALLRYMKNFVRDYSDKEVCFVLDNRKYKKSTIAFLESILKKFSINNTLDKYLSPMSNYRIPQISEVL